MMEAIKRILVVDDEEEFVNTVKRHLKRERFILHSAKNGEDACEIIHQAACDRKPYDLVITDVIMPKVSGIELLQWIKIYHATVSVLVVSGFGDQHQVIRTIRPDMDACSQKPLTPFEMMRLIGEIDKKRRDCGCLQGENPNIAKAGGLQTQEVKGGVVVDYRESLTTQNLKFSSFPDVLGHSSKSEAQRVNNMTKSTPSFKFTGEDIRNMRFLL